MLPTSDPPVLTVKVSAAAPPARLPTPANGLVSIVPPFVASTTKALPPASPVSVVLPPLPVIRPDPAVNWTATLPAKPEASSVPVPLVRLALLMPESVRLPEAERVRRLVARVTFSVPSFSTSVPTPAPPVAVALPALIVELLTSSVPGAVCAKFSATGPPAPGVPSGLPGPPLWSVLAPPTVVRLATVSAPALLVIEIAPPAPPSPPLAPPLPGLLHRRRMR